MAANSNNGNMRLYMKTNSLRNNTLECGPLGTYYRISTDTSGVQTTRVTSISKWIPKLDEKSDDEELLLVEWKRSLYLNGDIKLHGELTCRSTSSDFMPLKEFLHRHKVSVLTAGSEIICNRTFVANNGKSYTWKSRINSLKLYCDESNKEIAVAHRPHLLINKRNGYLELISDWEDILDHVVVSFVIVEKLRKEEEFNSAAIAAAVT